MNPKSGWFSFGIARRKEKKGQSDNGIEYDCDKFYGISTGSQRWLDDRYISKRASKRKKQRKINKQIDLDHFKSLKDGEIDIFVDPEIGEFKMCIVGNCDEDKEVVVNGIHKSGKRDGWVPQLL